jgi:phospholipase C
MCIHSGTSGGRGTNDKTFDESTITEMSTFEMLTEKNVTWMNYDGTEGAFNADSLFYNWTIATGKSKTNVKALEHFFQDAYLGELPQYSYINPSCCDIDTNSMHPTGPISTGEVLIKQIYDALRASPQWDNMLFIITFDESGGFYDHNAPPTAVRPDDLTYTEDTPDGSTYTLNFDRYGGRIPTWIVSPFVQKGHVEHEGVNSAGKTEIYSATSVLRTLGYLWDFDAFTPRVEASPSFDHLIQTTKKNTINVLPSPHKF